MSDRGFRVLLSLFMVSDPWPLDEDVEGQQALYEFLEDQARERGFENWVDAYHNFQPRS